MSLLIFSTSFLTRSLLWKNLTKDLSYFHDLSFRISHKFAFCENSHAKNRILRKFAFREDSHAKNRTMRKFAKFRIVSQNDFENFSHSHRFAKSFQEIFAFASLRIFIFNAKAHPWPRRERTELIHFRTGSIVKVKVLPGSFQEVLNKKCSHCNLILSSRVSMKVRQK